MIDEAVERSAPKGWCELMRLGGMCMSNELQDRRWKSALSEAREFHFTRYF